MKEDHVSIKTFSLFLSIIHSLCLKCLDHHSMVAALSIYRKMRPPDDQEGNQRRAIVIVCHFSQPASNYSVTASQYLIQSPERPRIHWQLGSSTYECGHVFERHKTLLSRVWMLKVHTPTEIDMECLTNSTTGIWDGFFFSHVKHKHTHNASLWVPLASIAERGRQGGGAALVVQGGAPIVDGWVDGDSPHARGIAIAVAVVVATTISRCPHVDAAFTSTPLKQHYHHPSEMKIWHISPYYWWVNENYLWSVCQFTNYVHNLTPSDQRTNMNYIAKTDKTTENIYKQID